MLSSRQRRLGGVQRLGTTDGLTACLPCIPRSRSPLLAHTSRDALVDRHLTLIEGALVEHHDAEDNVVWPLLLKHNPDVLAPMVTRMEAQHERVLTALAEIKSSATPGWRAPRDYSATI
jgi:hypothetical protein